MFKILCTVSPSAELTGMHALLVEDGTIQKKELRSWNHSGEESNDCERVSLCVQEVNFSCIGATVGFEVCLSR